MCGIEPLCLTALHLETLRLHFLCCQSLSLYKIGLHPLRLQPLSLIHVSVFLSGPTFLMHLRLL